MNDVLNAYGKMERASLALDELKKTAGELADLVLQINRHMENGSCGCLDAKAVRKAREVKALCQS